MLESLDDMRGLDDRVNIDQEGGDPDVLPVGAPKIRAQLDRRCQAPDLEMILIKHMRLTVLKLVGTLAHAVRDHEVSGHLKPCGERVRTGPRTAERKDKAGIDTGKAKTREAGTHFRR